MRLVIGATATHYAPYNLDSLCCGLFAMADWPPSFLHHTISVLSGSINQGLLAPKVPDADSRLHTLTILFIYFEFRRRCR